MDMRDSGLFGPFEAEALAHAKQRQEDEAEATRLEPSIEREFTDTLTDILTQWGDTSARKLGPRVIEMHTGVLDTSYTIVLKAHIEIDWAATHAVNEEE
jgi:hypothetical protein